MNSRIDDNLARAEALVESAERGKDSRDPRDIKSRTIGQVLSQLDLDFPGISASKIRFWRSVVWSTPNVPILGIESTLKPTSSACGIS